MLGWLLKCHCKDCNDIPALPSLIMGASWTTTSLCVSPCITEAFHLYSVSKQRKIVMKVFLITQENSQRLEHRSLLQAWKRISVNITYTQANQTSDWAIKKCYEFNHMQWKLSKALIVLHYVCVVEREVGRKACWWLCQV